MDAAGRGLDHGEDPADAAVREVHEETGYAVRLDRLLTVHSFHMILPDAPVDFHGIQIVYAATVIGGELRYEVDGTTDMAAWHPMAEVPALAGCRSWTSAWPRRASVRSSARSAEPTGRDHPGQELLGALLDRVAQHLLGRALPRARGRRRGRRRGRTPAARTPSRGSP